MARGAKKDPAPHVGVPVGPFIEEYCVKPRFDDDGVQSTSGIGVDGREYPDPVPMSPPVGYVQPDDLLTMIRTMVRDERFRQEVQKQEFETEEEANDFDCEDDPLDELTPYEKVFEPPPAAPSPPVAAVASTPGVSPAPQSGRLPESGTAGTAASSAASVGQPESSPSTNNRSQGSSS